MVGGGRQAEEIRNFLAVTSEMNRFRILELLRGGSMTVTDIYKKLKMPQNLASHHISRIKKAGLLVEKREGTFRHYGLNSKEIRKYCDAFKNHLGV